MKVLATGVRGRHAAPLPARVIWGKPDLTMPRSGRKPNKTRRRTICAGVIDRTAHFMKMKLEPQISPRAANAP